MKTLQLSKVGNSVAITEWDIKEETKNLYFKDHDSLVSFIYDGIGENDLLSIARKIRPVMEGWLRYRYPYQFTPQEWLGDMTKKIQEAGDDQPLSQLNDIFDDLHNIKEYTKKYHHNQINPSDNEPIDQTELEGYVKRTLKLMGSY
jgi:wobble nucleotide-excising tRNase